VFIKVVMSSFFDTKSNTSIRNVVEVKFENFVFSVESFDPESENGLF